MLYFWRPWRTVSFRRRKGHWKAARQSLSGRMLSHAVPLQRYFAVSLPNSHLTILGVWGPLASREEESVMSPRHGRTLIVRDVLYLCVSLSCCLGLNLMSFVMQHICCRPILQINCWTPQLSHCVDTQNKWHKLLLNQAVGRSRPTWFRNRWSVIWKRISP